MPSDPVLGGLLERVRSAKGADRKLDAEIDAALFGGKPSHLCKQRVRQSYGAGTIFDLHGKGEDYNRDFILTQDVRKAPKYTTYINAACALVERRLPTWGYRLTKNVENSSAPSYVATLFEPPEAPDASITDGRSWSKHHSGGGITPALALCCALLAALSQGAEHAR